MKKNAAIKLTALLIAAVCTLVIFSCNEAPVVWETDYTVVKQNSETEGKDMLLFFSGDDWDGISPDLMANFLSSKQFMKAAGKDYILYKVNVPADVSTISDEEYTRLMVLTGSCGVNTCPAIVLCDQDGAPYYELSYLQDTTTLDDLINDVKTASAVKKVISSLEKKLETAQGAERVKIIDELVSTIPEAYMSRYYELMATIPIIDPDNESGLVGKYTLVAAEQKASMLIYSGDYIGALDEFANASDSKYLTVSQKQECLYYAAYFATQMDLWEEAISYMERAYILDPESDNGQMIASMLPTMKANLEATLETQEE